MKHKNFKIGCKTVWLKDDGTPYIYYGKDIKRFKIFRSRMSRVSLYIRIYYFCNVYEKEKWSLFLLPENGFWELWEAMNQIFDIKIASFKSILSGNFTHEVEFIDE